ncbi:hypothetical protein Tco_0533988 [Tanacetum coccineum]
MRHGFDLGYKTWVHHGEPTLPPPPPVIDNTRQPQMSDMTALLNDLSYIPPNNEHNKPTQGDIGETSNEPTQATRNEFEELYASANEELYPGCNYVTRLDFMAKFTYFKWKGSNTQGKKVPKKVLRYFLIIPRLQHLYKSSHTAKEMIWYATGKCTEPEPRNVRLGLAADGFNPFGNLSQAYSMWPMILTTYNLPSWLCMKESYFMMTLLIPGPKSPGKDIDVYLRPLIEDLKTINDFPARSSLSGWSGQGYKACPTCNEDTLFVRVLSKTAYVGYKRFLKKPHKWRSSREFNGPTDNIDPSKEFGRDKILAQLDRLLTRLTDIMHIEKNVLEAILNTLLMNDKSKDTAKARQDLQRLGIRSSLWLGQTKKGKCLKPQAAYSFTPEDRKKFCQFIKGVKLPDGFGSCFKHKVTANDTNIMGLKSHDCHIMMQRLLLYGLQNYLPDKIAKPIIKLCLLFKQICSITLMEDVMLKAQIKVVDILCDLEIIYPPALFEIMIHLVIHLPLEALEAGLFAPEEALTFSSHYFWDVTMKFNRPDRNVDPPPLTCQFQVFRSVCKSIGLWSVIRFDAQELKKVKWYVLHNSPEIDTYRSQFKSLFPNKDMKEEFPEWFGSQIRQRHVDNDKDPEVSTTSELFALACGPTWTPISINSCVVDGVRYVVHSRDERRTTQNSGICSPGPDEEMYYGQLQEILEFKYLLFKVVLFRVKWFDTRNQGRKVKRLVLRNNMTQIDTRGEAFKDDQYILVTQVKQVFYLEDKAKPHWKVVEHVKGRRTSVVTEVTTADALYQETQTKMQETKMSSGCCTRHGAVDGGRVRAPENPIWVAESGSSIPRQDSQPRLKAITDKSGPNPFHPV